MTLRRRIVRSATGALLAALWQTTGPIARCLAAEPTSGKGPLSAETSSLLSAIVKVSGSLLVVVGLMLLLLWAIKRTGLGSGLSRGGSAITVLETRMVAPKKYIAIVDVAGHCLALGITDHNINLLSDLGPETMSALKKKPAAADSGFAALLQRSLKAQHSSATPAEGHDQSSPSTPQEST